MSNDTSWEKNALETLLLDNLKDKRSERRWRTFWRIVWLLIFGAALYSFFGPLKSKSSSVLGLRLRARSQAAHRLMPPI